MRLNILSNNIYDLPKKLERNLDLMADHILVDQKKDGLTVNLKFVSSKEMKKLNKKKGCASLCIGGGMGIALCIERI